LQKLEGFTGMNSNQLLEVATKVFVNQDQETRWEADRKMKRNVKLLAATLAEQSRGPGRPNLAEAETEAITMGGNQCPWDAPL
jgi:hypothetical protein